MSNTQAPTVSSYEMTARNGRRIRTATKVAFADGTEIAFTEKMGKAEAIRQAIKLAS